MRIISIDSVKGNEILAKDIYNDNDIILMSAGMTVKMDYVRKLKELNIKYIYVEDEIGKGVNLAGSLDIQIKDQCNSAVRNILLKYSYQNSDELEKIKAVADEIIYDIMQEPEVIYNLTSIRDKNDSTYSHSINVCAMAVILSFRLKLTKAKIRDIAIGCLLHDIGFTFITIDYHNITFDTCTDKERKEIMKHIVYGYSAIQKMEWLTQTMREIVISHHERMDGSGYPFHLKADKLKIGSKIVAVCDEFDSRVYGNFVPKMKVHEAIEYIISKAGTLFDLTVVKAFRDSIAAYPTGSLVRTNTGEEGIVLRQNPHFPTRPVIRIIKDGVGQVFLEWRERDLMKELSVFIADTIAE